MDKKIVYISFYILVFLLLVFGAIICFSDKKYGDVVIANKEIVLGIGEKEKLSTTKYFENLYWESSDESIVSIDSITGEVIGINEGTASIRVSLLEDLNIFDNCIIKVINTDDISISDKSLSLIVGDTYGISVIVNSGDVDYQYVEWKSSNSKVATVNEDGFVKAVGAGSTTITATTINNKVVKCEVTVFEKEIEIKNIAFKDSNISLEVGDSKKLDIIIDPLDAVITSIVYDSNNKNVVAVDSNGKLLAIGPGKTDVLAKINNERVIRCTVTVTKKDYQVTPTLTYHPTTTPSVRPTTTPSVSPTTTPSVSPTTTPSVSPTSTPSKIDDQITLKPKTAYYTGSKIEITATSKSGLPVLVIYHSDSSCKNPVNPIKAGTYYAIGRTSGNSTYNSSSTSCTKVLTINKYNDEIKINFKSVNYTGKKVFTTATSKSGLPVKLTYYSDSSCRLVSNDTSFLVNPGIYYAIGKTDGNDAYNSLTTSCTKAVEIKGSYATGISLNKKSLALKVGSTYSLVATVSPSDAIDKTVTWKSSNANIVTVNNSGIITGKSRGNAVITASTSNGKTTSVSVAVIDSELVDSYESSTLSYYIEKPDWTYIVTHVWVKDAYNQMKVAITPEQTTGTVLPRMILGGSQIMRNEVDNKGYQSKGLVAINGSAMVSDEFNLEAPSHWFGTAALPYILNDGKVIRDSLDEQLLVAKYNIIYGLTKNGELKSYKYSVTKGVISNASSVRTKITNDGVKYTFGFRPVIRENGNNKIKDTESNNANNIRQVLCQVDKNNFIIITSTIHMYQRDYGLSMMKLQSMTEGMNCITAFNLDGGGSTTYLYKQNNNNILKIGTGESITPGLGGERGLADMVYFVEK